MGKYNGLYLLPGGLTEIASLMETLTVFSEHSSYVSIDHVQVGDCNGDIVGKLQYEDGTWRFHARRHDKPGTLGE